MRIVVPADLSLPLIPPGGYRARVSGYKVKTSSSGNSYIFWEFTLMSQGPDEKVSTVGRKVFDQTTLTEESLWKLNQLYNACTGEQLPPGEYSEEELINFVTSRCLNREIFIKIEHDVYQGQTRVRVTSFGMLR